MRLLSPFFFSVICLVISTNLFADGPIEVRSFTASVISKGQETGYVSRKSSNVYISTEFNELAQQEEVTIVAEFESGTCMAPVEFYVLADVYTYENNDEKSNLKYEVFQKRVPFAFCIVDLPLTAKVTVDVMSLSKWESFNEVKVGDFKIK